MSVGRFSKLFILTVCLVLVAGLAEADTYVDHKDGTITAKDTSLMWQQSDDGVERTWGDAVAYCEDLQLAGHKDWMLPDIQMLENLIDNAFSPTVNPVFSVRLSYYWSATEGRESVNAARYINFFYGNTYSFIKDNTYYAICVRDVSEGKAEQMRIQVESDVTTLVAPFQTQFSAIMSGGSEPYFFEWDFNDGEFSSLSNPSHSYIDSGIYQVVVTVTDNDGAIAVGREELTLSAAKDMNLVPQEVDAEPGIAIDNEPRDTAAANSTIADNVTLEDNVTDTAGSVTDNVVDSEPVPIAKKITPIIADEGADINGDDNGTVEDVQENGPKVVEKESGDNDGTTEVVVVKTPAITTLDADESIAVNPGYLKIFASNDSKLVQMPGVKEGLLVYSFGNGLRGDADWNKDGKVTARELKGYLGSAIDNLSQGKQKAVMNMSENDFDVCAVGGTTYLMAVGVDLLNADGVLSVPFAAQSAKAIGQLITEECSSWKQLVLTGKETGRNNVIRALLKIRRDISSKDNFIFYFAGPSEGSEQGLNLFTYDTIAELPAMTGLEYDKLANLLEESDAANIMMLFEVGSNVSE